MKQFLKLLFRPVSIFLTFTLFLIFGAGVVLLWWKLAAQLYLTSPHPSGSDFYNALTYAKFFRDFLTWPPSGWMHFWNEGTPVVGGYPWLFFYLVHPFYKFFNTTSAVEIFSIFLLLPFFIFSFILFWQVSRSLLLAFLFVLVLLFTKASYLALFAGGFLAASAVQFLLPLSLIFLFLFRQRQSVKYLVLAAQAVGFSLLLHPPTASLLVVPPALVAVFFAAAGWKNKLKYLTIFTFLAFLTGSMGLYTLYNQVVLGQGTEPCHHPQCWGVYPEHFIWFHPLSSVFFALLLPLAFLVKLFKRKISLSQTLILLLILLIPVAYCLAAYFKLINPAAEAFFPRRTFWAITLFLLLAAVAGFRTVKEAFPKLSLLLLPALFAIFGWFFVRFPDAFKSPAGLDYPASFPMQAEEFVSEKYKKYDFTQRLPEWFPLNEQNYRFLTFNQEMNVWWNLVSPMPAVLGYSNHPLGRHRDWLYFLQSSVDRFQPEGMELEPVRNRAHFLLDAYGTGFYENSGTTALHPALIADSELVVQKEDFNGLYLQFSPKVVTPIVSPTNSPAVLFVGDEEGYANFIRTAALANLNSQIMIPVKGPENFNQLSQEEFKHFKVLVLYRFQGGNWRKLEDFVKEGGNIFIESGSLTKIPKEELPEIFPVKLLREEKNLGRQWQENLDFAPLSYQNAPWSVVAAFPGEVREWAKPTLTHEGKVLMAEGSLGQGKVVWSGWNLLYHAVSYSNLEEAKLFGRIIQDFTKMEGSQRPNFQVKRPRPEKIEISAEGITGIYFKENYHFGWGARNEGKKLKLYRAGLDFMYFPLAENPTQAQVALSFNGGFLNWGLFLVTLLTVAASLLYLVFSSPFHWLKDKISFFLSSLRKKLHEIWERD